MQINFNPTGENHLQVEKSAVKIGLSVILLIVLWMCPGEILAQDTPLKPLPVNHIDTLEYDKKTKRLFKKVLQLIKFKENRENKEKERIYQFMLELIKNQDLNIDSNMNEIIRVLDSIHKVDGILLDSIYEKGNILNKESS